MIVTHRDDEISYDFKSKNFILEFGTCVRKFVKVIFSETFMSEGESPGDSLSLVESISARNKTLSSSQAPIIVLDSGVGGAAGAGLCALLTLADQREQEEHCDIYQAQLRFERHKRVHKLFLNMWGVRNRSRRRQKLPSAY